MMAVAFLLLIAGAPVDHHERSTGEPESSVSEDQAVTVCGNCVQTGEHTTTQRPPQAQRKKKTPRVIARVSPRSALYFPERAPVFKFSLDIMDANEEYWCPKVVWEWPDGTISAFEEDCRPFEQAEEKALMVQRFPSQYRSFGPGVWHIRAAIEKAGKVIMRTQPITVTVGGNIDLGGVSE